MFRRFIILFCLSLLLGCTDGSLQIQAHTAGGVAQAANASLPILIERMRRQGLSELQQVLDEGGSRDDALAVAARVEAQWEPIWTAWDVLQIAQDRWATALENGGDLGAALTEMRVAFCQLRRVWPSGVPAIPLAPLRCADE